MDPMPKHLHDAQAAQFRTRPSRAASPSCESHFLLAALLLLVAKGDGAISSLESQKVIELLSSHFGIRNSEALASLSSALTALANDKGIAESLRTTSRDLPFAEKQAMFTLLLQLAAVDGEQDSAEIQSINVAAEILEMSKGDVRAAYAAYFSSK
jgi:uncharacterized tellurite resistance protein B-like protein